MSGFSSEWLSLREPIDARSRSDEFVRALRSSSSVRPLQAIDLGTGTGSNIRYTAPRLGGEQRWLAVDDDPKLIEQQPAELRGADFHCTVSSQRLDLAADLDSLQLAGCHLVTGSALLDLVSASWLELLASRCAAVRASVLFALNYDGRVQCTPHEPDDQWLIDLINRHQRSDKGFGPALGPDAARHARAVFDALGYRVRTAGSDWLIEPDEQPLQRQLIAGWIGAAREIAPSEQARIEQWGRRREAHLVAGTSRIRVGHQDFVAWPTAPGE
ncbi:MAG: class I SAM-dependent methyltransferase [Pseudomonadota bacterium]|nr:class I SAM-dependent methyltransferase [Pseudomonadota bacterium]